MFFGQVPLIPEWIAGEPAVFIMLFFYHAWCLEYFSIFTPPYSICLFMETEQYYRFEGVFFGVSNPELLLLI